MIMLDWTIVAVANPTIMTALDTDYDSVIWATSGYLLGYAVPLLVAGRLGDRYGPKNVYLLGLTVFTAASLWCGLSGSIGMLVAARVVHGLGSGLLTPQTMTTITRAFPANRRGAAMTAWGATVGIATLLGPIVGGLVVSQWGWQWIFLINVPLGIVALGLAGWLVPALPTHQHRFDFIGVALSAVGLFLIVLALQEGQSAHWAPWIWVMIGVGTATMVAFVWWQRVNTGEPLIPLQIFGNWNFTVSNIGIAVAAFALTAEVLPVMFFLQTGCGLEPRQAALLTAPMAAATAVLAPLVGRVVDRLPPGPVLTFGFSVFAGSLFWLSIEMAVTTPVWRLVLPFIGIGVGLAFVTSPLAAVATRNLAPELAGAGSGVYNACRQAGSVLGSAAMASFLTWRLTVLTPRAVVGGVASYGPGEADAVLPADMRAAFAAAMSQSVLLLALVALLGVVCAVFLLRVPRPHDTVAASPE